MPKDRPFLRGDIVLVRTFGSHRFYESMVEKVTPTGRIKTNCGKTFNSEGISVGGSQTTRHIIVLKDSPDGRNHLKNHEVRNMQDTFLGLVAQKKNLTRDQLSRLIAILNEPTKE